MKLWNDSYQAIIQETKTIEMRLNDPKRRKIKKGISLFLKIQLQNKI